MPAGAGAGHGAALRLLFLPGAAARRAGPAVPRQVDLGPALPGAAAPAARDPRSDLHQARPDARACARTSCPASITDELKNLLDRLPVVPFDRYLASSSRTTSAARSATMFAWIDPVPLGSASIAQIHRATHAGGRRGRPQGREAGHPRDADRRDAILLGSLGRLLQLVVPRYQPRRIIPSSSTTRSARWTCGARPTTPRPSRANFHDMPDVVFPTIYRQYSGASVLCMEFFDGLQARSAEGARDLPASERERLVDLGAAAIIRMLYRDGFFHADLHPGNLIVLPGTRVGFIDLGMVGRFDERPAPDLLYYYYALVTGDAESAARYLCAVAVAGARSRSERLPPRGRRRSAGAGRSAASFRRASRSPSSIMESVNRGRPLPHVLPGRDGADGEGARHLRGRRPACCCRGSTSRACREAHPTRSSSSSSARSNIREVLRGAPGRRGRAGEGAAAGDRGAARARAGDAAGPRIRSPACAARSSAASAWSPARSSPAPAGPGRSGPSSSPSGIVAALHRRPEVKPALRAPCPLGRSALRGLTLGPSPRVEREGPRSKRTGSAKGFIYFLSTSWRGGQGVRPRRAGRPD